MEIILKRINFKHKLDKNRERLTLENQNYLVMEPAVHRKRFRVKKINIKSQSINELMNQ